nr:MAG TPA: hypothetical protein [Caudoviricetes sp.]
MIAFHLSSYARLSSCANLNKNVDWSNLDHYCRYYLGLLSES